MVSSLKNNKIDFKVLFDESDDEDYTVIFDKNSFSYKIYFANDLKTDLENDNEKVSMPSFLSAEPKVSCFDDLDLFKDFENEFPAIVYNVALTSKSEHFTKPTLCPQHIDEFDLKNETSLSEYNEVEQNILYLNDLFLFNIIYLDDLKSGKDNDDDKFDIIQSSEDNVNTQGSNKIMEASHDKNSKLFIMEDFIMELNVNIVAWNYLDGVYTRGMCGGPKIQLILRDEGCCIYRREAIIACCITEESQAPEKGSEEAGAMDLGSVCCLLVEHFGLLTEERLQGFTVIVRDLPMINMGELVRRRSAWFLTILRLGSPGTREAAGCYGCPPPTCKSDYSDYELRGLGQGKEDMHEIQGAPSEHREILDSTPAKADFQITILRHNQM
ncbi:hypothetical protein Tco_1214346 [Tanacetum coccineum]